MNILPIVSGSSGSIQAFPSQVQGLHFLLYSHPFLQSYTRISCELVTKLYHVIKPWLFVQ